MNPNGRPPKLATVCRDDGRTVHQVIIDEVRRGQPLDLAAALAGIARTTVYNWLRAGARVAERRVINPDTVFTDDELAYDQFLHDYDRARAEAEAEAWALLGDLARGGVMKRVTRKMVGGQTVEETATVETARPSFQALRYMLDVKYDRAKPLEVRVAEGALSDDDRAAELARAIDAWMEAEAEAAAVEEAASLADDGDGCDTGASPNGHGGNSAS